MPQAAAAVQAILGAGFIPSSLEIADQFTLEAARREHGRGVIPEGNAHLLVDVDGQPQSVVSEMAAIEGLVADLNPFLSRKPRPKRVRKTCGLCGENLVTLFVPLV